MPRHFLKMDCRCWARAIGKGQHQGPHALPSDLENSLELLRTTLLSKGTCVPCLRFAVQWVNH